MGNCSFRADALDQIENSITFAALIPLYSYYEQKQFHISLCDWQRRIWKGKYSSL